jgi:hypothetical protein
MHLRTSSCDLPELGPFAEANRDGGEEPAMNDRIDAGLTGSGAHGKLNTAAAQSRIEPEDSDLDGDETVA